MCGLPVVASCSCRPSCRCLQDLSLLEMLLVFLLLFIWFLHESQRCSSWKREFSSVHLPNCLSHRRMLRETSMRGVRPDFMQRMPLEPRPGLPTADAETQSSILICRPAWPAHQLTSSHSLHLLIERTEGGLGMTSFVKPENALKRAEELLEACASCVFLRIRRLSRMPRI